MSCDVENTTQQKLASSLKPEHRRQEDLPKKRVSFAPDVPENAPVRTAANQRFCHMPPVAGDNVTLPAIGEEPSSLGEELHRLLNGEPTGKKRKVEVQMEAADEGTGAVVQALANARHAQRTEDCVSVPPIVDGLASELARHLARVYTERDAADPQADVETEGALKVKVEELLGKMSEYRKTL